MKGRSKKADVKKMQNLKIDAEPEDLPWEPEEDVAISDDGFDASWLEQFVLEMNVDILTDAVAVRNLVVKKPKTAMERFQDAMSLVTNQKSKD